MHDILVYSYLNSYLYRVEDYTCFVRLSRSYLYDLFICGCNNNWIMFTACVLRVFIT
jgi:hypothetical protein